MKQSYRAKLHIALTHYPVTNKNGSIIAAAVTNLDLHDIARVAKTYGIQSFYVITPLIDQRALIGEIRDHWINGPGANYNANRREAMELIQLHCSMEDAVEDIRQKDKADVQIVATSARRYENSIDFASLRRKLDAPGSYLLVFGTAWGLTPQFIEKADYILAPIETQSAYNHLSVRCAAAIILDRIYRH